jgi:hypothetical protein
MNHKDTRDTKIHKVQVATVIYFVLLCVLCDFVVQKPLNLMTLPYGTRKFYHIVEYAHLVYHRSYFLIYHSLSPTPLLLQSRPEFSHQFPLPALKESFPVQ